MNYLPPMETQNLYKGVSQWLSTAGLICVDVNKQVVFGCHIKRRSVAVFNQGGYFEMNPKASRLISNKRLLIVCKI